MVEIMGTLANLSPQDLPKGTSYADLIIEHDLVEFIHKHLCHGIKVLQNPNTAPQVLTHVRENIHLLCGDVHSHCQIDTRFIAHRCESIPINLEGDSLQEFF